MKGASRIVKGTRHRIYIYRICDLVYYRVRVVVGEGLSGYPQIGTRGTEGYGQHFGRGSSNDVYTNPLLFLFLFLLLLFLLLLLCWLCGGGDRPDPITCREAEEAEAWMMDQSQHEGWDDIAII